MKSKSLLAAVLFGSAIAVGSVGCTHLGDKSAGAIVDDATITTKVKAKFIEDPLVKAMNIKVDTYQGVVQLSGFANSMAEAEKAGQIARNTSGVKSVKNDIRLAGK
ncbi:MAG: BON domain-containing protein [Pseudomonadota bacterium]|nr:BON domain-containing protein [Pseudomonadota bacterium]